MLLPGRLDGGDDLRDVGVPGRPGGLPHLHCCQEDSTVAMTCGTWACPSYTVARKARQVVMTRVWVTMAARMLPA
jgi:hypothetical protein